MVHNIHEHDRARVGEVIDIIADFIDDIIGQRTGILDDQVLPDDFRHECREPTLVQSRGIRLRNLEIKTIEVMEVLDFVDGDLQSIGTGLRLDDHMVVVEFLFLLWNFVHRTLDGFHHIGSCPLHIMIGCLCSPRHCGGWWRGGRICRAFRLCFSCELGIDFCLYGRTLGFHEISIGIGICLGYLAELLLILAAVFHEIHLLLRERAILELQLHGLVHILAETEEKHDFITGADARILAAGFTVELCEGIEPLLVHFLGGILLERCDKLLGAGPLRLQDQIAEEKLSGVVRAHLTELVIKFLRILEIACLDGYFSQLVQKAFADRGTLKRQQKDILRLFIFTVMLIDIRDVGKKICISNATPVDRIGDLHRGLIVSLLCHLAHLLCFNIKLVLIHLVFLLRILL